MKFVICDDESIYLKKIEKLIINYFKHYQHEVPKIFKFTNGQELKGSLKENCYDFAYIDIELLDMNGLDLAKEIMDSNSKTLVTFITSHNQYVSNAFTLQAFQYINKPIDVELFEKELKRAINIYKHFNITIPIKTKEKYVYCNPKEIIYVESYYRKVNVMTVENTAPIRTTNSLKSLMELLNDYNFIQTHQSYYVNMFYIKEIGKNHVIMRNGVSIPISPYKYELVMEKYNLYLQEVN